MLLSTRPDLVQRIFKGHTLLTQAHNQPFPDVDWVISYGHRHIIKPDVIAKYKGRILNVHWAYLPYNRGADPNLWAWYDGTPHGVTVHHIDEGLDTGPIVLQLKVNFLHPEKHTLETSYAELQGHAIYALQTVWQGIVMGKELPSLQQDGQGSYHRVKDREKISLPAGWKTPVEYVQDQGRRDRGQTIIHSSNHRG